MTSEILEQIFKKMVSIDDKIGLIEDNKIELIEDSLSDINFMVNYMNTMVIVINTDIDSIKEKLDCFATTLVKILGN